MVKIREVYELPCILQKEENGIKKDVGFINNALDLRDVLIQIKLQSAKGFSIAFYDVEQFTSKSPEELQNHIKEVKINSNGDLEYWPDNLFAVNKQQLDFLEGKTKVMPIYLEDIESLNEEIVKEDDDEDDGFEDL